MGNHFVALPAPVGNGVGATVSTVGMGRRRTIIVGGSWVATVNVEVSCDGGTTWGPLATFLNPSRKEVDTIAANAMRIRVSGYESGSPAVTVGADGSGGGYFALNVPAGNGVGTATDVSVLRAQKTVVVSGAFTGAVIVEISENGTEYADIATFSNPNQVNIDSMAAFMRVRRVGFVNLGTPVVTVGSANDEDGGLDIVSTTGNLTATPDTLIRADPSGAPLTVTLPPAAKTRGQQIVVKNVTASVNAITIMPSGGDTVDGGASTSITSARGAVSLVSDGVSDWVITSLIALLALNWSAAGGPGVPSYGGAARTLASGRVVAIRGADDTFTGTGDVYVSTDATLALWTHYSLMGGLSYANLGNFKPLTVVMNVAGGGDVLLLSWGTPVLGPNDGKAIRLTPTTGVQGLTPNMTGADPPQVVDDGDAGAVELNDGRVIVFGGTYDTGPTRKTWIYTPGTNTWAAGPNLSVARAGFAFCKFADGRVGVFGGFSGTTNLTSIEILAANGSAWSTSAAVLTEALVNTNSTPGGVATLLANGRALVTSVWNGVASSTKAWIYDPTGDTITAVGDRAFSRAMGAVAVDSTGNVIDAGGMGAGATLASAERYSVTGATWANAASMAARRSNAAYTVLANKNVWVWGGEDWDGVTDTVRSDAEQYG